MDFGIDVNVIGLLVGTSRHRLNLALIKYLLFWGRVLLKVFNCYCILTCEMKRAKFGRETV